MIQRYDQIREESQSIICNEKFCIEVRKTSQTIFVEHSVICIYWVSFYGSFLIFFCVLRIHQSNGGLQTVSFEGTSILELSADTFQTKNHGKEVVILKNCKITCIRMYAFENMRRMVEVNLSDNKISKLVQHTFSGASTLAKIMLYRNRIETIEPGTFDLPRLTYLDLSYNALTTIPVKLFHFAAKLVVLLMGYNRLRMDNAFINELPAGLQLIEWVPYPNYDIAIFGRFKRLHTLKLGQGSTATYAWPLVPMKSIQILELTPTDGYDIEKFTARRHLFPNLRDLILSSNIVERGRAESEPLLYRFK